MPSKDGEPQALEVRTPEKGTDDQESQSVGIY